MPEAEVDQFVEVPPPCSVLQLASTSPAQYIVEAAALTTRLRLLEVELSA